MAGANRCDRRIPWCVRFFGLSVWLVDIHVLCCLVKHVWEDCVAVFWRDIPLRLSVVYTILMVVFLWYSCLERILLLDACFTLLGFILGGYRG